MVNWLYVWNSTVFYRLKEYLDYLNVSNIYKYCIVLNKSFKKIFIYSKFCCPKSKSPPNPSEARSYKLPLTSWRVAKWKILAVNYRLDILIVYRPGYLGFAPCKHAMETKAADVVSHLEPESLKYFFMKKNI